MEAGVHAFVSYVRGYKEHQCKYIFRMQELALGRVATSMAVLRLPRMPELRKGGSLSSAGGPSGGPVSLPGFTPSSVDPETVRYKDKAREKQRQASLRKAAEAAAAAATAAASSAAAKQARVRQSRDNGGTAAAAAADAFGSGERLTAAKRRQLQQRDEADDLEQEYKLLKKLKRGKISQRQFDIATGLCSDEDDDGPAAAAAASLAARGDNDEVPAQLQPGRRMAAYLKAKHKRKKRRGSSAAGGGGT
mmetsp:Transcript_28037/g.83096  ORF Transcript_28037/g.83096 Transcript_28037/m.83096 type:complete len:249 (-) Transcript_28037:153-899(-)